MEVKADMDDSLLLAEQRTTIALQHILTGCPNKIWSNIPRLLKVR